MRNAASLLLGGGTLLGAAFGACAPPEGDGSEREVTIGVIVPLSGDLARAGKFDVRGATLAAEEIQRAGGLAAGVLRWRIRMVVEDDEGRAEIAVSKAVKLIEHEGASVLLGAPLTRVALAVAKVAAERQVPMISTQSTHPDLTSGNPYAFRMTFTDDFQGRKLAEFAARDLGARSAAVLADAGSTYSLGLARTFRETFEENGGTVTAFETFTIDESDFSRQLLRIRESGAEALVLPVHSSALRALIRQAQELGITCTLLGGDAWANLDFDEGLLRRPAFFTDVWDPQSATDESQRFVEAYRRAYGEEPATLAALAYDSVFLVAQAILSQEDAAPESIRAGLRSLGEFRGATGKIRFGPTGDPLRSAIFMRVDAAGRRHPHKRIDPVDPAGASHP